MRSQASRSEYEVLVVGGGIAGLSVTALLAEAGFEVACVDAMSPAPAAAPALDGRTTALLQGAVRALAVCGVWRHCAGEAEALRAMRIVDENGRPPDMPVTATFEPAALGEAVFGYNVPNAALRRALMKRLGELPNASHVAPAKLTGVTFGDSAADASLADGRTLRAALVIGADGKGSPTREAAGIAARRWSYGQTALAFSVAHTRAHEGVSTEFHRPSGPFVLVPLPGNQSSVVWVERERAAPAYLDLDDGSFMAALQTRTRGVLGRITAVGPRFSYPVTSLLADSYAGHRVALLGEAAHALPPIGAQGLNLGMTDAAALAQIVTEARRAGQDIGADSVLKAYERWRRPDVIARVLAVDALNRAVMTRLPPINVLRHFGLSLAMRSTSLKASLMRQGMAPLGTLPKPMQGIALEQVRAAPVAD